MWVGINPFSKHIQAHKIILLLKTHRRRRIKNPQILRGINAWDLDNFLASSLVNWRWKLCGWPPLCVFLLSLCQAQTFLLIYSNTSTVTNCKLHSSLNVPSSSWQIKIPQNFNSQRRRKQFNFRYFPCFAMSLISHKNFHSLFPLR